MRCRQHPRESPVGVCALCLTDRLLDLIAQEEERRFKSTQSLHICSPLTFYEERASISEEREVDRLHARLGISFADSERQSKSALRDGNTNQEGNLNQLKLSPVCVSSFSRTPEVAKSRRTDKCPGKNHRQNEGFMDNEVAGSSPWRPRIENTFNNELPPKRRSWIYSWLLRRKSKRNPVESLYQANNVADESSMPAMSSLDHISSKKCLENTDPFNRRHDSLQAQFSPIHYNYAKQESSSFLSKRGTKIWSIFTKNSSKRSTSPRYRESENSKVDDCLRSGSIHPRNGLFHRHAKGASPSSVTMESEDDQRASPVNRPGAMCNVNFGGVFPCPKTRAGKMEGIQYNDCAGSFSPYVERRSMQSPKRFTVVSNELSGLRFCLSPLKRPGRKLYPQASV